jgi:Kdo2-lipid IVA lauroyltransferase/acyltransferase
LLYYLALPFIYLLSILPFPVLYLFSDLVYLILYRGLGYRKKVVLDNLRNSFPDKSEQEIKEICNKFYRYLCDLFIETFKLLTISQESMLRHCSFTDETKALTDRLAAEGKSFIAVMGHYGNWEWAANTCALQCKHQTYGIYHPLSNKHFDGLVYKMRTRFGTKLIPMKSAFREMLSRRKELNGTAFIADQTPQPDNAHWMTFLHQDTPVFKGTEIIAKKLDLVIIYTSVDRVKRGHYKIHAELLTENSAGTAEGEITELHTRRLEQDIIAKPEIWLWSHRRWKHKRPSGQ